MALCHVSHDGQSCVDRSQNKLKFLEVKLFLTNKKMIKRNSKLIVKVTAIIYVHSAYRQVVVT